MPFITTLSISLVDTEYANEYLYIDWFEENEGLWFTCVVPEPLQAGCIDRGWDEFNFLDWWNSNHTLLTWIEGV